MNGIMLCGGDLRQISAANMLTDKGYDVYFYKNPPSPYLSPRVKLCENCNFENCSTVILPLPCSEDDVHLNCSYSDKPLLEEIFSCLSERHNVYGGKFTPYIRGLADRCKSKAEDLLENESFSIKNAYLTAEGAVKIALAESKIGLLKVKILVVGFGRIGKCLAHLLKNMGAEVFVSARKPADIAWIENYGYSSLETKNVPEKAGEFDIVFNTVPVNILSPFDLPNKTLYVELASKPYGIDLKKAQDMGKNALLAQSLPGKVSPVAAGKIIAQTVINLEKEGRI